MSLCCVVLCCFVAFHSGSWSYVSWLLPYTHSESQEEIWARFHESKTQKHHPLHVCMEKQNNNNLINLFEVKLWISFRRFILLPPSPPHTLSPPFPKWLNGTFSSFFFEALFMLMAWWGDEKWFCLCQCVRRSDSAAHMENDDDESEPSAILLFELLIIPLLNVSAKWIHSASSLQSVNFNYAHKHDERKIAFPCSFLLPFWFIDAVTYFMASMAVCTQSEHPLREAEATH